MFSDYALFRIENDGYFLIRAKGVFDSREYLKRTLETYFPDTPDETFIEYQELERTLIFLFDDIEKPAYLFLAGVKKDNLVEKNLILASFLREVELIESEVEKLPNWYREILWETLPKQPPLLLQSEMGSMEIEFMRVMLKIKYPQKAISIFEPGGLSEKVQSFELFGDDPGERFPVKSCIPVISLQQSCIVIKEIADLTLLNQERLYRYLRSEKEESSIWFFSTHYDLQKLALEKMFDFSMWEFLKKNTVILPPVRKVPDSEFLHEIFSFLGKLKKVYRKDAGISEEAIRTLLNYEWPGNLVEFYKTLETAFLMAREDTIEKKDLRLGIWEVIGETDLELRKSVEKLEKEFILKAYRFTGGNLVHMANALGISRGSLQYKIQKYGLNL